MAYMKWTRDLEFGISVIDTQHKQIVELINELDDVCQTGNAQNIQHVIEALLNYTVTHFDFEEELQQKAQYPYIKAHRRVHDNFRKTVATFRERSIKGDDIAHELLTLLNGWLVSHIKSEDLDYVEIVKPIANSDSQEVTGWMGTTLKKFFG
jgi:hemerythrin